MVLIGRFRSGLHRFLSLLDSEGVGIFQAVVYIHLAVGGAYCLAVAGDSPESVEKAMGPEFKTVWLGLCVGATVCLAGKLLSGHPERRTYWVHTTGLLMQLAGDIFAFGAFSAYVLATWQSENWGKPLVAVWVFAGLAECTFLLVVRDFRRVSQAERQVRR